MTLTKSPSAVFVLQIRNLRTCAYSIIQYASGYPSFPVCPKKKRIVLKTDCPTDDQNSPVSMYSYPSSNRVLSDYGRISTSGYLSSSFLKGSVLKAECPTGSHLHGIRNRDAVALCDPAWLQLPTTLDSWSENGS